MVKTLKDAGRYEEVINILKRIISDSSLNGTVPVDAFVDNDNRTVWRIDGKLIKEEAVAFLQLLENNCSIADPDEYFYLNRYVQTKHNMLLHNYATLISHRKNPEAKYSIEVIRNWLCLGFLLDNLGDEDKYIPMGWNKYIECSEGRYSTTMKIYSEYNYQVE